MRFLLVHSPAVGPSTWRWVGEALRAWRHEVIVPNLVAAALTGDPRAFARSAGDAAASDEATVIVGHSAAGPVLPLVATRAPNLRRVVFVDASVPPCDGPSSAAGEFLGALQGMATGGVLPERRISAFTCFSLARNLFLMVTQVVAMVGRRGSGGPRA